MSSDGRLANLPQQTTRRRRRAAERPIRGTVIMTAHRFNTAKVVAAWLPLVFFACSTPKERQVLAGSEDHGCKPGTGLQLTVVGERVEGGTFSIIAPEGLPGPSSVQYPIQVLSQTGDRVSFRVDLQVGAEAKPFFFDASLARQADGTLHVWVDQQGANTPREDLGPPMILKPVDR